MKIGLACYKFKNLDLMFNLSQIESAVRKCQNQCDVLFFGEAFLQGFSSLSFNFDEDKKIAVSLTSEVFSKLKDLTLKYNIALGLGYYELDNHSIYSSYAIINNGKIIHNYKRISPNWKVKNSTNHYKEGNEIKEFNLLNKKFLVALCGDIFINYVNFKTKANLIWPIYVNFSVKQFNKELKFYETESKKISENTFIVNSLSENPKSVGNAFYIKSGNIDKSLNFNEQNVLLIDI